MKLCKRAPLSLVLAALVVAACGGDDATPRVGAAGAPTAGSAGSAGESGSSGQGGDAGGAASTGPDPCAVSTEPTGSDLGQTLPDLAVQKLGTGGEEALQLHALRASCERPGLLVVRIEPSWCEPCGWRADATEELLGLFPAESIDTVTVLYAGPDNALPTPGDLSTWRAAHPSLPGVLTRSRDGAAAALVRRSHTIPLVLLVDRRTLRISNALDDPDDGFFVDQVAASLEEVGGPVLSPTVELAPSIDERFDAHQWRIIQKMASPLILPPSPSNLHADDPAAASLGQKLFQDISLASDAGIACASCHRQELGFSDGLPTAKGVAIGALNTPGLETAAWNRWQFWDGRADSLWSQALGPLENPLETAGNRLHVAHRIRSTYASSYEALFGPLPPLEDGARFPAEGKPGEPAYEAMTPDDQSAVTRVFVNVGKSLEAFERTLRPAPMRLEAYASGDFEALTPLERNGLHTYLTAGCANCHGGPTLSNGAFFDILMPSNSPTGPGDRGRIDGVPRLLASPFRADGVYSDDPQAGALLGTLTAGDELLGQMKTPSLRGVTRTGPWGHGGTFSTLEEVMKHYGQAKPADLQGPRTQGDIDPAVAHFAAGHNAELLALLKVFGGE